MKTPKELLDERLSVQNGFHKGATVTISRKAIEELMEEYHAQFEQEGFAEKEQNKRMRERIEMGILATELRIGNWYLSTKFQVPVICEMGDFYEIYARADGSTEYTVDDIFQSIPLTEEWLLKFGIIFKGYDDDGDRIFSNGLEPWFEELDGGFYLQEYGRKIEYVHQLQNLYFALTGEELKIN